MKVTEQELRKRYEALEADALLELYETSDLTELASSVLKDVMIARGIEAGYLEARTIEEDAADKKISCRPASIPLPRMWIGYAIVAAFVVYGVVELALDPSAEGKISPGLLVIALAGASYWLHV